MRPAVSTKTYGPKTDVPATMRKFMVQRVRLVQDMVEHGMLRSLPIRFPHIIFATKQEFEKRGLRWRCQTHRALIFDTGNSFGFVSLKANDDLGKAFKRAAALLASIPMPEPWRYGDIAVRGKP